MIHFYRGRNSRSSEYKIICTQEWTHFNVMDDAGHPTSTPSKVTCPACIRMLLPKLEHDIAKMRARLRGDSGEASFIDVESDAEAEFHETL